MALLATESLDLGHRQALHPDAHERCFDLIELERLDDRLDLLHMPPLNCSSCVVERLVRRARRQRSLFCSLPAV
jgi:hypothetical protein